MSRLRTTSLFALVCGAAVVLAGIVIWQVVAGTLRAATIDPDAARDIVRALITTMLALGVILIGVAIVAGRAYARSLNDVRAFILAHARGDRIATPDFAVKELSDVVSSVERLSAHVSTREAHAEREGVEKSVLLDAISEGVLQLDSAGRLVRANPAARALLGLPDSAVGKPVTAHIRHAQLRGLLEQAAAGRDIAAAEIALDDRRVIVSARPLAGAAGNASGTVVAFVDLTEVRRLENVRRDFVANVSHELKTPLTSIRGYVETLLADEDLPPEVQRQFLTVVQKNASRLHHIVDDLLDLSRLESGGWRPELHEVDVNEVIDDVWSSCSERSSDRHIAFNHTGTRATVIADPGGLRQVLSNLLDNALRYTPDGGRIEVRVADGDVAFSTLNGGAARRRESTPLETPQSAGNGNRRYIVFEVRDTGSGIPTEALPRIFERFYRVDPARSRAEGGTGLGLSIVKHLVESMGGDIAAESELGKGTVIRFRLPAAE